MRGCFFIYSRLAAGDFADYAEDFFCEDSHLPVLIYLYCSYA